MGDGEELLGPPTLGWEEGLPCGRSELARHLLVCSVLMKGLTKLKFAILRLGATIYDRGKSERSVFCHMEFMIEKKLVRKINCKPRCHQKKFWIWYVTLI